MQQIPPPVQDKLQVFSDADGRYDEAQAKLAADRQAAALAAATVEADEATVAAAKQEKQTAYDDLLAEIRNSYGE